MNSLHVLDLAGQDIHILCLAASSEKIKPLLYCTPGPAENFWHLLTKDNLNHEDFISATRGALINQEGKKAAASAAASTTQLQPKNVGAALELESGRQMCGRLRKEIPSQLCDLISKYYETPVLSISIGKFLMKYRRVQYNPGYQTDVHITSKGQCVGSSDATTETEVDASLG